MKHIIFRILLFELSEKKGDYKPLSESLDVGFILCTVFVSLSGLATKKFDFPTECRCSSYLIVALVDSFRYICVYVRVLGF